MYGVHQDICSVVGDMGRSLPIVFYIYKYKKLLGVASTVLQNNAFPEGNDYYTTLILSVEIV